MGWVKDQCVGTLFLCGAGVLKSIAPGVPGAVAALVVPLSLCPLSTAGDQMSGVDES